METQADGSIAKDVNRTAIVDVQQQHHHHDEANSDIQTTRQITQSSSSMIPAESDYANDDTDALLEDDFKFGHLKVVAHARERWSLRRKGGTLADLLSALDYGGLQFTCKREPDTRRWLVAVSNEVTLVLDRHRTKIITVLRQRNYDYVREAYEQRLHTMATDELPWGELMPRA